MPQGQLPLFPNGVTEITHVLEFKKEDNKITYINGLMPVFVHNEEDVSSFRMITAQKLRWPIPSVNTIVTQMKHDDCFNRCLPPKQT